MDIFRTGGWGGAQIHSIAFGGVFPDITKPILYDENSKQSQNLPTKNDHFAPKLMSFYCQGQVSPKMVIYGFFGEMSRAAGTRFKKKDPLECSLIPGGGLTYPNRTFSYSEN